MKSSLQLYLAQGLGLGRIPVAPGTFGTLGGVLWVLLLLRSGSLNLFLLGTAVGLALAIWLCGNAEKILRQKDPSSVVLDEIAAFPLCFLSWVVTAHVRGEPISVEHFTQGNRAWAWVILFLLFRLFDVWKPWLIRSAQHFPGGYGVVLDDVAAALAVALVALPVFL